MMHFTFSENTFRAMDEKECTLETTIQQLHTLPVRNRLSLIHTDVSNYVMSEIQPYDAWFSTREQWIREYASLNWNSLGTHLNTRPIPLGQSCFTIHKILQELLSELNQTGRFQLTMLCSVLSKIDRLWHILLPSDKADVVHPDVIYLLSYFGQW
jgi:hypothetical protein